MINLKLSALAGALAIGFASMASAASITFNYADANRSVGSSIEMTDASGVKLTTTAASYTYSCFLIWCDYTDLKTGGGVKTDAGAGLSVLTGKNDGHWVDGGGTANDVVVMTFSKDVTITGLKFTFYENLLDGFGLSTDFTSAGPGGWLDENSPIPNLGEDNVFYLWSHYSSLSAFKVKTVTVEYEEPTNQTPVPLPASGVLLLGALGGVAAMRRRRKA